MTECSPSYGRPCVCNKPLRLCHRRLTVLCGSQCAAVAGAETQAAAAGNDDVDGDLHLLGSGCRYDELRLLLQTQQQQQQENMFGFNPLTPTVAI